LDNLKKIRCIDANWFEGNKDPELTTGHLYSCIAENIKVEDDPEETYLSLIGNSLRKIQRPARIFEIQNENTNWIKRLKKADIICSHCHDSWNDSKSGSWRFTGEHWEHKCDNLELPQSGHFIGVCRKQLEKERVAKLKKSHL
jgi:hypothetical protein